MLPTGKPFQELRDRQKPLEMQLGYQTQNHAIEQDQKDSSTHTNPFIAQKFLKLPRGAYREG